MLDQASNDELIQAFWSQVESTIDWVVNRSGAAHVHVDDIVYSYERLLKQIDENLTLHMARGLTQEVLEMVIGCDGYAESIASVMTLVQAAPLLNNVRVSAFHDRLSDIPNVIETDDVPLQLGDVWFHISRSDRLHLSLFISDFRGLDEDARVEAVMYYLDAFIGEYDMMTRVATLNWYQLPADPLDFGLRPLSELREEFDNVRTRVRPVGVVFH
ncbi:hypothetical protein WH50_15070 [Pokkaliibacter plantistimulans]|uniref:Uncharacterized protein n=1 Tax=Pokkaliibacter plantistimulans TaxID=1635171 RepID=A0ABX5M0L8_9GAMM|nr:hypothetical protein [Pokkaliibacter plantistimulans]PXF30465.1 hypothetical protein WH50_15070 [Pokkaliibacter plantistimulans]